MKKLIATLFLLVPGFANAGSFTITWTAPTQNTDGTPIGVITSYAADYWPCTSATAPVPPTVTTLALPPTPLSRVVTVAGGQYCVRMRATTAAGTSANTNIAVGNVPVAPPNPPSDLTISNLTAYKLRQAVDGFSFASIGSHTVPVGTPCAGQRAGAYVVVPRAQVTMASKFDPKPLITFALCS